MEFMNKPRGIVGSMTVTMANEKGTAAIVMVGLYPCHCQYVQFLPLADCVDG